MHLLSQSGNGGAAGGADDSMRVLARRAMGGENADELEFGGEVKLGDGDAGGAAQMYQDKFRARKPKYFNRVHTGYEWNKYNRTHYDHDNPPPKLVQGYKFNVFYPDLIDPSKPPTFKIEPDPSGTGETVPSSHTRTPYAVPHTPCAIPLRLRHTPTPTQVLLRFTAGPPYEDLAFRIVNREWEYGHKRGFKCTFDRGILHLYFNFRRYRYRR